MTAVSCVQYGYGPVAVRSYEFFFAPPPESQRRLRGHARGHAPLARTTQARRSNGMPLPSPPSPRLPAPTASTHARQPSRASAPISRAPSRLHPRARLEWREAWVGLSGPRAGSSDRGLRLTRPREPKSRHPHVCAPPRYACRHGRSQRRWWPRRRARVRRRGQL